MTELSVPSTLVCPHRLPRVGYWQFPDVSVCSPNIERKKVLPARVTQAVFLEHYYTHTDSIHVFTEGSKSDVGVGCGVIFPSSSCDGSLPPVPSVFTAEFLFYKLFLVYQFHLLSFF